MVPAINNIIIILTFRYTILSKNLLLTKNIANNNVNIPQSVKKGFMFFLLLTLEKQLFLRKVKSKIITNAIAVDCS